VQCTWTLHYLSLTSIPTSQTVFCGFHYAFFKHTHIVYFEPLHTSPTLSYSPPSSQWVSPCPLFIFMFFIAIIIILDLHFTYKWNHVIFSFFELAYFAQNDLQFHLFSCKQHDFILLKKYSGWVLFHYVYIPHLLYPFIVICKGWTQEEGQKQTRQMPIKKKGGLQY
jgi:hypothetical protein